MTQFDQKEVEASGPEDKLKALRESLSRPKSPEPTEAELVEADRTVSDEDKTPLFEGPKLEKNVFIPESISIPPKLASEIAGLTDKANKTESKNGTVRVRRTYKEGRIIKSDEMLEEDMIEVRQFVAPTATVGHLASMSINMDDFENVKIQVLVSLPCYLEEVEEAYKTAKALCDVRLNKQVRDIKEYRDKKRKGL